MSFEHHTTLDECAFGYPNSMHIWMRLFYSAENVYCKGEQLPEGGGASHPTLSMQLKPRSSEYSALIAIAPTTATPW